MNWVFLFISLTAAFGLADQPKEEAIAAEQKLLQGKWQVVKFMDQSEQDAPPEEIKEMTFEFKDGVLIIAKNKDGRGPALPYRLDPTKKPKWIDLNMGHPYPWVEGIYQIEGNELKVCVIGGARGGKVPARPKEFKAKKQEKYSLFVLKRI